MRVFRRIVVTVFVLLTLRSEVNPQSLFYQNNNGIIDNNEVVAEVGELKITAEEFFYSYEFGPAFSKRKSNSKETHLKYMINEKLIALKGYEENFLNEDEVIEMYKDIQTDIATEEMFKEEILAAIEIDSVAVDSILQSKMTDVEIKWLYSADKEQIKDYWASLQSGASFDSLFKSQINDSVFLDMRSMKTTFFTLKKNNPLLAQIIDTMSAGKYSAPIHVNDEWYIVKLSNIWRNMISNQTEINKLKYESEQAYLKFTMERESDIYVNELIGNESPVIKKEAFDLLRAYLGKYILPKEKYTGWNMDSILETALSNLGLSKGDEYPGIELIVTGNKSYMLDEFITWYRNRNLYIKFDQRNLLSFSRSIENYVWLMFRDRLLTERAVANGYFENNWVKTQSRWWSDKISYSAMRNKLTNSVLLENEEIVNRNDSNNLTDELSTELTGKIFRLIQSAKREFKVVINNNALEKLNVTEENNPKAIELYTAKKSGLIPRPPYPTIDNEWANWE